MDLFARATNQMSFPEMYERMLVGPLFRPWAELMMGLVRPAAGERVLDVACGTGILARLARERTGSSGHVVGVDLTPGMLAVARDVAPDIDWREGNAGALPLKEGEHFDVVLCQQGMQFFPDKPRAAQEMRRALAPNGRLAVSTWRSDDEIPLGRELRAVAEKHVGPIKDARHSFGDGEALARLLTEVGIRDVQVNTMSMSMCFTDGSVFVRLNAMALINMSAGGKDLAEHERTRILTSIEKDSAAAIAPYTDANGLAFELKANIAIGRG